MKSKICCWRVVSFRSAIRVLSPVRTCVRNCKEGVGRHQAHLGERARLYTRRPARACGGIGRRARLRAWSCNCGVEVRILSGAYAKKAAPAAFFMHGQLLPSDRPPTVPNTCSTEGKDCDGGPEAHDAPAADLRV